MQNKKLPNRKVNEKISSDLDANSSKQNRKQKLQVIEENSSSSDVPLSTFLPSKQSAINQSDSDSSLHSESTVPLEQGDADSSSSGVMFVENKENQKKKKESTSRSSSTQCT